MKRIPKHFIDTLLFCTEREAQLRIDKFYPGWKIKAMGKGVAHIFDPNGTLVQKIVPNATRL